MLTHVEPNLAHGGTKTPTPAPLPNVCLAFLFSVSASSLFPPLRQGTGLSAPTILSDNGTTQQIRVFCACGQWGDKTVYVSKGYEIVIAGGEGRLCWIDCNPFVHDARPS